MSLIHKTNKLLRILRTGSPLCWRGLLAGVAASAEHWRMLANIECATIVDVGANRGQFALAATHAFPRARIVCFEPLPGPADRFRRLFCESSQVTLHQSAIGPATQTCQMHVSARDDSSSLLPISDRQSEVFPGTEEVGRETVQVAPLDTFLSPADIAAPALLKLDVQGFELDALRSCESLLPCFDRIYCECSFIELYAGQALAAEVIGWLAARGFRLTGVYNPAYDGNGQAIQTDFLFKRTDA